MAPPPQFADKLRALVVRQRAQRAALEGTPLVDPRLFGRAEVGGDVLLRGMPGSPGVAEGPVRVVRDSAEFGKLRAGDVLVAPYTNPAWTPLFERAAAVVVDSGGPASHAAIVAREYGIPAVMATVDGTRRLTAGLRVRVDGARGLVLAVAASTHRPASVSPSRRKAARTRDSSDVPGTSSARASRTMTIVLPRSLPP
jgi:pyruvate,water dikinase